MFNWALGDTTTPQERQTEVLIKGIWRDEDDSSWPEWHSSLIPCLKVTFKFDTIESKVDTARNVSYNFDNNRPSLTLQRNREK